MVLFALFKGGTSMKHKIISILLATCMAASALAVGSVQASASEFDPKLAQNSVQGGAILHCFNWSYDNIRAALPDIAAAGYTAVQTSPVQPPKEAWALQYREPLIVWRKLSGRGFFLAINRSFVIFSLS